MLLSESATGSTTAYMSRFLRDEVTQKLTSKTQVESRYPQAMYLNQIVTHPPAILLLSLR